MTDKMTPGMRADVLELLMAYRDLSDGCVISRVSEFREEAARREAEQKLESVNLAGVPEGCQYPLCNCPSRCPDVVEDKPAPAADDLVARLDAVRRRVNFDTHADTIAEAADRIEAQARKLSEVRSARDRNIERAEAFRTERDTLKARVAELEEANSEYELAHAAEKATAEQAEAKAARLVEVLELILPFAKGYVANNAYGRNRHYIAIAEAALAEAGHGK